MKIYWHQGGIMHEPETPEEREAMLALWNAPCAKVSDADQFRSGVGLTSLSGSLVHSGDGVIID
jgi:hypothetical protein